MEIAVVRNAWSEHPTPLLVVMVPEGADAGREPLRAIDDALAHQLSKVIGQGDFKGKEGSWLVLYPGDDRRFQRVLLVGLGKAGDLDTEKLRRGAATAAKQAGRLEVDRLSILLHDGLTEPDAVAPVAAARAIVEGAVLASYRFDQFKSKDGETPARRVGRVELLEPVEQRALELDVGARIGGALARGEQLARTLGNLPGNVATPDYLAEQARAIASRFGSKVTVLGRAEMEAEGLRTILAVAQGSTQEPKLIVLEHLRGREGDKPLVLVGKGLTFDAGGISIKPAAGMEDMKFDMCGAAAVLGAMQAIGELEVPANVVAIIPSSENLLGGGAMKPGDIIRSHAGKTIEVINTDAEGRLLLADALSYARRFEPAAVIDAATLTGSCVMALGNQASAGLTNDEDLLREVREAGDRVGQRVWPLPMFSEYRDQIKSDYADIKNSGGRPAGTITAAWFLREFVGDAPWVHLDIAGTAYGEGKLAYQTKGATGAPARLFVEWVLSRVG